MTHALRLSSPWIRRAAYGVGSILLIWALAWAGAPMLIKSQIERHGSAALGRALTVGAVDFKPWSLELTLRDLAIATADGKASQLTMARVYVDAELQSLMRLGPVLDAVVVDTPTLQLTRSSSGHYDIDDILAHLNTPPSTGAPLRFALYNLALQGGSVNFTDTPAGRQHSLRKLQLSVPFLSNLEAKRDITVEPHLAFELNGSPFDTAAQGTPFAQTRKGEAHLTIAQFDITPYLPYWPADLPVQAKGAVLDANVKLGFVQTPQVALTLSGTLKVSNLKLTDTAGAPLLGVQTLQTVVTDLRPLEQRAKLASLDITGPTVWASRNRAGVVNWSFTPAKSATKSEAAHAAPTGATGTNDVKKSAPDGWQIELTKFSLGQGTVKWSDDATRPKAQLALTDVTLQAHAVQWPFAGKPAAFSGTLNLAAPGKPAQLIFEGEGTDQTGTVHTTLSDFALASAAPYVASFLEPRLQGAVQADMQTDWKPEGVLFNVKNLTLRDVALRGDKATAWPQFKALEISDARIDPAQRSVQVGKIALRAPNAPVVRNADGSWVAAQWFKSSSATTTPPATKPWRVAVDDLGLTDGTVDFTDSSLARRVRLAISGLNGSIKNWTLDGKKTAPLSLTARIKSGRTEPGSLAFKGTAMWDPVTVQGSLDLHDIPAHTLARYFDNQLNLELLRADTSFKGQVRYAATAAGARVDVQGDGALDDFRANSILSSKGDLRVAEELLSWKSLNVPGIQLAMAPGTATRLDVREAALTDFFARVIVQENGRLNLQDLVKPAAAATEGTAVPAPTPEPAPVAAAAPTTPDAVVHIGPISMVQGKVLFSDRFIKPNYSADLSELNGKLSQFASVAPGGVVQLADLDLRGRAEGTASLEITGKVNPLARPLALDIKGRVRDLELPPLSPYAIKYAGYGITRGKLSMDVGYTVQPDGQLIATNNLVLNQLMFGDKVEGAPNSLPVKLAVALLADRKGVIDINLPISGSLNDPQFKLGSVVFKLITNLVMKAITSPFTLLAGALGGSDDEAGLVRFAPGSSVLAPDARATLDKVAKALVDRPALKITVTGSAALEPERTALKRERLGALLMAEKRRRASVASEDAAQIAGVTAAEYPVLLKAMYRRADITKPRNLVGLTKDISGPDMESLLMASMDVTEDAMLALALQRGVAVKDYLATQHVPTDRLYLGGSKLVKPDPAWQPQAELSLSAQ